jgi:peptidoglycan/LPS O-acetylase OafA/YrhL
MNYRQEIDGLRAIAVLGVIFFHADLNLFSGGFVGVDVFFVISGYLITSIIMTELELNRFSLIHFYERRARRILPALFLVVFICILFALLWLLPDDMRSFSRSLVYVLMLISNIFFWSQSSYFDSAAELKPLLHTWSLAVEEQYYILLPLFLLLFTKTWKYSLLVALSVSFVTSLALAHYTAYAKPVAGFFLLPTRAWELLLGSIVAFYLNKERVKFSKNIREIGGALGLILIIYAATSYNNLTPFPSLYTLAPTVGAVLIIIFSTQTTTIGKLLGNNTLAGIGLISYSLYLWHWPLFVFARHKGIDTTDKVNLLFLVSIATVFSLITYKFIEIPFRDKTKIRANRFFLCTFSFSALFVAFALISNVTNGFSFRLEDEQKRILSYNNYNIESIYRLGECFLHSWQTHESFDRSCSSDNPSEEILIWGDSHAAALAFGLRKDFKHISQFSASGCPPLIGVRSRVRLDTGRFFNDWRPMCGAINEFVANEVLSRRPKAVLLHASWLLYDHSDILNGLTNTITLIRNKSPNTEIFVLGAVPRYKPSLPTFVVHRDLSLADNLRVHLSDIQKYLQFDSQLREYSLSLDAHYFSSLRAFCVGSDCLIGSRFQGELMPVAWDIDHLTAAGSVYLSRSFKSFLNTTLNSD